MVYFLNWILIVYTDIFFVYSNFKVFLKWSTVQIRMTVKFYIFGWVVLKLVVKYIFQSYLLTFWTTKNDYLKPANEVCSIYNN